MPVVSRRDRPRVRRPTSRTASSTRSARTPSAAAQALGYLRGGGFVTARIGSGEAVRVAYLSGTNVRQNAKVPVRTAGLPGRHLRPPAQHGRRDRRRRTASPGATAPTAPRAYAGPDGRRRVRHVPQPARERRVPHPQPHPGPGGDGHRRVRPGRRRGTGHRRGAPGRRRQPQLHHHPDQRRHRHAHGEPGRRRSACRRRPATTGAARFRGTARAARPTTRRTASPRPSSPQISTWCLTCHTRYLSAGWDVETPDAIYTYRHTVDATRPGTASRATWHTVPTRR